MIVTLCRHLLIFTDILIHYFTMPMKKIKKLLDLLKRKQVIRSRDLDQVGVPRNYLGRLVHRGQLQKIARGLYSTDDIPSSEHVSLVQVSNKAPKAVVCLLSALRFHNIGTQIPSEVWIAIDTKARPPRIEQPAVRIVRFSGAALHFGMQRHDVGGTIIKVYTPAKTVADCFKFRHKIGMDVALEALRECYRQKKGSMEELWNAAKVCRVANVMRPYMEALA
jgi:predicted transcriptional regulator of viral defense system